jgi:hypothetical protein
VYQKDWQWYVSYYNHSSFGGLNKEVEFQDGMKV